MLEDELRRTFERHEELVPDGTMLRDAIDSTARGRRVRRRWVGSAAAALAVTLVLGVPVLARAYLPVRHSNLLPAVGPATTPPRSLDGLPINFLVAGLDRSAGSTNPVYADTVMIAHVSADRGRLYLVTLPRDLWVEVPGHPAMKINESYAVGGFPLLASTVSKLSGLSFDGAATIEYGGLTRLVDAVGGVDLCVDQQITSIHTGQSFLRGCQHFSGREAMDYVRQRMTLRYGVLDRDRHQVQLLTALLNKLHPGDLLANPGLVNRLLRAAGSGLVMDLNGNNLAAVVDQVRPALGNAIGVPCPVSSVTHVEKRAVFKVTSETREFFTAMRADALAGWLRDHPKALTSHW